MRVRVLVLSSLLLACESPHDRACRALLLQASDAEATRTYVAPERNVDAHRAESVARWLRATDVEDPSLHADADALAAALDRLGAARLRIENALETLAVATGVPELVAKAERARLAVERVRRGLPRCTVEGTEDLATRIQMCIDGVAPTDADESRGFQEMLIDALWAKENLPTGRPANETVDRANDVPHAIADRARAEEDVKRLVGSLREKCAR